MQKIFDNLIESVLSLHRSQKYEYPAVAEVAQLVEHDLAKVGVASSSLVFRSKPQYENTGAFVFLATKTIP